jgi:hypothetical protein
MPLQDRLEEPDPVTVVGVRLQVRPVAGLTAEVSPTRPLKPCCDVIAIVDVPGCPARAMTIVGLEAIVKSCTVYVTVAE